MVEVEKDSRAAAAVSSFKEKQAVRVGLDRGLQTSGLRRECRCKCQRHATVDDVNCAAVANERALRCDGPKEVFEMVDCETK